MFTEETMELTLDFNVRDRRVGGHGMVYVNIKKQQPPVESHYPNEDTMRQKDFLGQTKQGINIKMMNPRC